jgi:hypothetical protein
MISDEDKLDALVRVLRELAEVAEQEQEPTTPRVGQAGDRVGSRLTAASRDHRARPPRLDVGVLEVLAASPFEEQVALQRLVADAFRD